MHKGLRSSNQQPGAMQKPIHVVVSSPLVYLTEPQSMRLNREQRTVPPAPLQVKSPSATRPSEQMQIIAGQTLYSQSRGLMGTTVDTGCKKVRK